MVRVLMAALLVCAWPARADAQERLTLEAAVQRALADSPLIRAVGAGVDASAARLAEARSGYLPHIDFSESWRRSDQPVFAFSSLLSQRRFSAADFAIDALNHPGAVSNRTATLGVEQLIFDGGRLQAAVRLAGEHREGSALDAEQAAADVRLATIRAYGRAVAAAALTASASASLDAAREDLARAERRRDVGSETEAGVLALQVRADEADADYARASGDEEVARAILNAAIAAPLDSRFELEPIQPIDRPLPDAQSLEAEALRQRPDIRHADAARRIAALTRQTVRAPLWPALVAEAGLEANGRSFADRARAWSAGVELRWNLFSGGADASRLRAAAADVRRADAERDAVALAARLEIRTALADARSAVSRERATRRLVDQSRESQRIVRNRYEAGLATAADLLRAAEAVSRADAARINATTDLRIAWAAIDHARGSGGVR